MSTAFDTKVMASGLERRSLGVRGDLLADQYGNLNVVQMFPPLTQLALAGKMFVASTTGGTYIAPAIAPLTTNAQHVLYNGSTGNVYLLLLACGVVLESGTRAIGSSLFGAVTTAAEGTAPTKYASSTAGTVGGHTNTAVGVYDAGVTLDATPAWFPIAVEDKLADANESSGILADLYHRGIIVPPGLCFAMSIRDSAAGTTPLYNGHFVWAEISLET